MQILSHPPLSAANLEQTQENFPSAVFMIDGYSVSVGDTEAVDPLSGITFPFNAPAAQATTPSGTELIDIQTVASGSAFTGGTIAGPGTTPFIIIEVGAPQTGAFQIGDTAGAGAIRLINTPVLYDGTGTDTASTGFTYASGTLYAKCIAVNWTNMMPYQYDGTTFITVTPTALVNTTGGIATLEQEWVRGAIGGAFCGGALLYFENGLPSATSIEQALKWMYHRAVDDGVFELPPFWSQR